MENDAKILEFLGDEYSRNILSAVSKTEKSALQLSKELSIPLATVYRKLKSLENAGLIQNVKTVINLSGNEEKYYKCNIRYLSAKFSNGKLSIRVKTEDYSDKFIKLWSRLTEK